jgi:hypothetical protein
MVLSLYKIHYINDPAAIRGLCFSDADKVSKCKLKLEIINFKNVEHFYEFLYCTYLCYKFFNYGGKL